MINGWSVVDATIYAAILFALTWGGNIFTRTLLSISGITLPEPTTAQTMVQTAVSAPVSSLTVQAVPGTTGGGPATSAKAGRMIGSLERLIILVGLVAGSWEIIAAVIALKTVGRFKELDDRLQAEYFLIGSLASVVWAATLSLGLIWFDRHLGFDMTSLLQTTTKA